MAEEAERWRQSVTRRSLSSKVFERRRVVVAAFDGGRISSDAGVLLLREVAERSGLPSACSITGSPS